MERCFSTEVVDLNNQMPNRNKRESKYYWDELYRLIATAGFPEIEVPYEAKWDFGGRSGIPRTLRSINVKYGSTKAYMEELKKRGIQRIRCVHMDPSLFCQGMMEMYFGAFGHFAEEAIQFAKDTGADAISLTATPPCYFVRELMKGREHADELFLDKTLELIQSLAKKAEEACLKLCLKNEFWGLLRGEKILDFLNKCGENVYLDIDTAHLQIAGVDVKKFILQNKEKIGIVHFTDTAFTDNQDAYLQALPEYPAKKATKVICDIGEGNVDFKGIQKTLHEADYNGTIVYNCKDSYDVYRSLLRTKYMIEHELSE